MGQLCLQLDNLKSEMILFNFSNFKRVAGSVVGTPLGNQSSLPEILLFYLFFLNCDLTVELHVRTSPFSSAQSYGQKESDYFISFGDLNFLFSPLARLVELSPLLTLVKGHSPSSPYFLLTCHNNLGLTAPASC